MRAALLGVALGLLAITPAAGVENSGNTLTLNAAEMNACATEGGCLLITGRYMRSLIAATLADGERNARVICGKTL